MARSSYIFFLLILNTFNEFMVIVSNAPFKAVFSEDDDLLYA